MNQRRQRRARALLLASIISGAITSVMLAPAQADVPGVGTQAPGYYRVTVGDIEVTALSDGTIDFPMDTLLVGNPSSVIRAAYKRAFQALPAETSMNQFLIDTGSKIVLVDAGAGTFFGPTLGNTVASLRAAGYRPEQVDEVVITHMHADHTGGLVQNGQRTFTNAVVRISRADLDFWMNSANEAKAPEGVCASFNVAQKALAPYVAAGKLQPFDGPTVIVPGISAVPAPGHTAGHTYYAVESKGEKLLIWGDVVHSSAVQFNDPSVRIAWDSDQHAAEHEREKILDDAARGGYLIAGAHLPFPGLGHVAPGAGDKGYLFVPVTYSAHRKQASSAP